MKKIPCSLSQGAFITHILTGCFYFKGGYVFTLLKKKKYNPPESPLAALGALVRV